LSIQPIVENAVIHEVLRQRQGGTVCIRIKNHVTYAEIAIIDDDLGIEQASMQEIIEKKTGKGTEIELANTDRRLKKRFGKGISNKSTSKERTTITFQVPIKQKSIS